MACHYGELAIGLAKKVLLAVSKNRFMSYKKTRSSAIAQKACNGTYIFLHKKPENYHCRSVHNVRCVYTQCLSQLAKPACFLF